MKLPLKDYLSRQIKDIGRIARLHHCDAPTAVGTILFMWQIQDFPDLPHSELPLCNIFANEKKVVRFVEQLRNLDFLEATYWLSSLYAMVREKDYRKHLAMYFTPPSLTKGLLDDLAEQGVTFCSERFIDPACGGAAFLSPIALRMRDALKGGGADSKHILVYVESHLYGAEKDPTLCVLCKQFLSMALYDQIVETGYLPSFEVFEADSLIGLDKYHGSVDVVVCNPPYRKMIAEELHQLRLIYDEIIEGQPNLYGLFIGLCVRLLKVGGYGALVTPTSFLSGQDFRKLRTLLMRDTDVAHIGMVSGRQGIFIDVEQETALTVVKKREKSEQMGSESMISVVSASGLYKCVGGCMLPTGGAAWAIPRSIEDVSLLSATGLSEFRLSDYGYRPRIGAYVWNRDKRPKYSSVKEAEMAKAFTALPLLWSSDISSVGDVKFDDTEKLQEQHRFVDLGDRQHPSVVLKPSVIMQRVTSNDQRRRIVAGSVPEHIFEKYGGFVGENHVVILEQIDNHPALNPVEMAELLRTTTIDRNFRCISGATNVSLYELRQLPLPNPRLLRTELKNGFTMEEAARRAFGLQI